MATVETLNRDTHLFQYQPMILIVLSLMRRITVRNNIYTKVIQYFKPRLFLGMTATPDKKDDDQDGKISMKSSIIKIAHEIRLQQAMEENLLCPFHYFGINEVISLDDKALQVAKLTKEEFNLLTQ
ncbi:MAG: hypothetical protein ACLU00_07260 [Mediterraneibacter faecis]